MLVGRLGGPSGLCWAPRFLLSSKEKQVSRFLVGKAWVPEVVPHPGHR